MGWMRPYWINSVNSKDFIMLKCDICEKLFDKLKMLDLLINIFVVDVIKNSEIMNL